MSAPIQFIKYQIKKKKTDFQGWGGCFFRGGRGLFITILGGLRNQMSWFHIPNHKKKVMFFFVDRDEGLCGASGCGGGVSSLVSQFSSVPGVLRGIQGTQEKATTRWGGGMAPRSAGCPILMIVSQNSPNYKIYRRITAGLHAHIIRSNWDYIRITSGLDLSTRDYNFLHWFTAELQLTHEKKYVSQENFYITDIDYFMH